MSMNNLKSAWILPLLAGLLVSCSEEVGTDANPPELPPIIPDVPTQIDIQETPLPIIEDFGATDAVEFFSPSYKALATPASNPIEDGSGNIVTLTDPWPSFYYPTCCFFQTDPGTGELIRTPPFAEDMDVRLKVGNNKMAMSNARFTIGQILSDLTPPVSERKRDTSDSPSGASLELGSWGELNLTEPYRVSFCLVDFGQAGAGASNLEVWVDNNSGGRQNESIHSNSSLLLRAAVTGSTGVSVVRGNRIVVDVPGDAYMTNNAGNRVGPTLGVIQPLDDVSMPVGTFSSFLQLRVSSGGYAVISNLVIEYQTENNAAGLPPCAIDTTFFTPPSPRQLRLADDLAGTPFSGLPLSVNTMAGEVEFFAQIEGQNGATSTTTGNYLAISNDQYDNFYKEVGSPTRIFVEAADNGIRFGNALWTMGLREGAQDNGTTPNGDIDLSSPYRISMQVVTPPTNPTYRLQVQIDNSTGTGANSVHGSASRIANLTSGNGLVDGTLVINVPGDILMNGTDIGDVSHVGTTTSFIAFRCPSDGGASCENAAASGGGLILRNIVVEEQ